MSIPYQFMLISMKTAAALLIALHLPGLWDGGCLSILRGRCTEWCHGPAGQPLPGSVHAAAPTWELQACQESTLLTDL